MVKRIVLAGTLAAALMVPAGCTRTERREEASREASEDDRFSREMDEKLSTLERKLKQWKDEAVRGTKTASKKIADAERDLGDVRAKLQTLKDKSGEAWQKTKQEVQESWNRLERSVEGEKR